MNNPETPEELSALIYKASHRNRWKWYGGILIILLLLLALGWFFWKKRMEAAGSTPTFETRVLARGNIQLVITATGNLEPTNKVTVGSELSGITKEVYVDTNDHVQVGQPLALLDTTRIDQQLMSSRASVKSAQAGVEQAKATLKEAEALLERQEEMKRLSDGRIPSKASLETSQATVDRARASLLAAEARVVEAEAQVRIQENDLSKTVIRSPIDGIVLTRDLEVGQTVAASFTAPELFVIAEKLEHMKLTVAIPEADIGRMKAGQVAEFTVDAWPERTYTATVRKVGYGSKITDNVVTYETELELVNTDLSLRPGMTATADIRVAEGKDVFLVPNAALRFNPQQLEQLGGSQKLTFMESLVPRMRPRWGGSRGGGRGGNQQDQKVTQIWVLEEGELVEIPVRAGIDDGRNTEIKGKNLKEGMEVVLRPYFPVP